MKTYISLAIAAALGCSAMLVSQTVQAQTCTAAGSFQAGSVSGNLCSGTKQLINDCNGATSFTAAPQAIYSVNLSGASSGTISVAAGSAYTPYLSLMSGACSSLSSCGSYEAVGSGTGTTATLPSTSGLAAGGYFVLVGDITENVTCPNANATYTLSVAGTLPVELKSFSVQ